MEVLTGSSGPGKYQPDLKVLLQDEGFEN